MSRRFAEPRPCDIAIVGVACCYSQARSAEQFWSNIVGKVDAITEVNRDRMDPDAFYDPTPGVPDKIYCKKGGWLGIDFAFNPLKYGTMPRNVDGAEPDQFLVLRTVYEAMEDAGYLNKGIDGKRVSIILGRGNYLGAGLSNLLQRGLITQQILDVIKSMHPEFTKEHLDEIKTVLRQSLPEFGPEAAPGLIPNITTGRVANRLDFMGKNFTIDAACASSLIATELGIQGLTSGQDDMVLAGGVHVFTNVPFLQVFAAMRALSPTSVIRPFDVDCDGTMPGEGVGVLVLKRLEDAEEAGDRIYAVIKGVGSSSDGKAKSVTAPRVEGEELAVRRAYDSSGILPETVQLIEAHGTGTPVGDDAEVQTLHHIFGSRNGGPPNIAVGSVKSMIGHAMPAAGAAGIIKTALALHHRVLPPSLHCEKPLPELVNPKSRFYVNTETRPWIHSPMAEPRRAGVNAFGFGGVNAHIILEEYKGDPAKWRSMIRQWESELIVVQADTREKLQGAVTKVRQYVDSAPWLELRDLAYTQNSKLTAAPFRVSIVAVSPADLKQKLERVEQRLNDPSCKQIKDTSGIYFFQDSPLRQGKVAWLFPGEGSQYLNMLSDLCLHFPEVRECFDVADEMVEDQKDRYAPSADIFPTPFFSKEDERAAEQRLWQMQRATEAVLTADGAMYTLLNRLGLKADMMAGHSAGEWVAMAASGILDIGEFLGSFNRLDHMYRRLAEDSDIPKMVMMAVGAGSKKVAQLVSEIDCTIHIANDNCPNQVVIVVDPKDADRVFAQIQKRGVFVEKLPYDRGYHTQAFTYICDPLRTYFSEMAIRAPHTPVYCCTTAQPYPTDSKEILEHVANTFARPLIFRQTIEAMYEAGARIFVEAGPRGNLTAFIDDILRGKPHLAVAVDQYRRPALTTLNNTLGLLTALHVPLDLNPLYVRRSPRMLTGDPVKDRIEDRDNVPGTMRVSLGAPKLHAPGPVQRRDDAPLPSPSFQPEPAVDVLQTHFQLMDSFLETQESVMAAFLQQMGSPGVVEPQPPELETVTPEIVTAVATVEPATVSIADTLLQIVSDRTGYPIEMLGMDLDLEADLGIDSIKRVEILSALQQMGGSEHMVRESAMEEIARLKTLRQVVEFLERAAEAMTATGLVSDPLPPTAAVPLRKGDTQAVLPPAAASLSSVPLTKGDSRGAERPAGGRSHRDVSARPLTGNGTITAHLPGQQISIVCELDPEEHLYLADHCFDPVGSDYDLQRNGLYFVPMTVSVAIMAEVAALLDPAQKVVRAKNVQAAKWIDVEKGGPRVSIVITAKRLDEQRVSVRITPDRPENQKGGLEILAESTIILAPDYAPAPNAEPFELLNAREPNSTGPELYATRRMFHGPSFHGISDLDAMGDNGLLAKLDTLPRSNLLRSNPDPFFHVDPYLLDAAGQLVGYWPIEYCTEGFVLFPIRIEELILYREPLKPGVRSVCQMRLREISQRRLKADLDVIAPDGKLWMRVVGWEDWRFYWPREFYEFWRAPNTGEGARRLDIRKPEGFSDVVCRRVEPFGEMDKNMWENLWAHMILSRPELEEYRSLGDRAARARWMCEKAVVKDAVCMWVRGKLGRNVYPADVEVSISNGEIRLGGLWRSDFAVAINVSVANDGAVAIAAADTSKVGIEIESLVHWETAWEARSFQPREREIVAGNINVDRDEWLSRSWCAKKAAGKTFGIQVDRSGELNQFVIEQVDVESGDIAVTRKTSNGIDHSQRLVVSTVRDGDYIIALAAREDHDAPR